MNYEFLQGAEAEYLEAIRFYEEQRPGLGAALIREFEQATKLMVEKPQAWKIVHPAGIRRISLKRFPFSIFFFCSADDSRLITAFAHHRRAPGYWLARIKS